MRSWIKGEPDVNRQRVEQAIACTDQLADQQDRIAREHRDVQTAFRLELALDRFPREIL